MPTHKKELKVIRSRSTTGSTRPKKSTTSNVAVSKPGTTSRRAERDRTNSNGRRVLGEGRFLRLVDDHTWEYVERRNATGVVAIVAVTPAGELLLTEQHRPAVGTAVIDLPAGLAEDFLLSDTRPN